MNYHYVFMTVKAQMIRAGENWGEDTFQSMTNQIMAMNCDSCKREEAFIWNIKLQ